MLRQSQKFLTQLYVISDIICMFTALFFAYWMKFISGWIEYSPALTFQDYVIWSSIYTVIAVLVGFMIGLYSPKRRKRFSFEFSRVIQVHIISFLALLSILFVFKIVHFSRDFLAIFLACNLVFISLYRFIVKQGLRQFRQKGYNKQFLLIVGAGSLGQRFYYNLQQYPELGYEVIGFLDDNPQHSKGKLDKPLLGGISDLETVLNDHLIDEVIIALPLYAHGKYARIIENCEKAGVKTLIIPDYFDILPAKPSFDNFAGIPLINVRDIPLDELGNRILKRTFDICFSLAVLILTFPLLLLIAVLIKTTSKGPILFKQERVGLNRRKFMMYKFRTMKVSTVDKSDTTWTVPNDERRTAIGKLLRKTSLDELPQFINVLKGNMSVVGPRPERPYFVEQFKQEIPKYMVKHHIRPGITGWAQAHGLRGDTSIKERINHDIFYLENWSFLLDLKIIWKTVWTGFINKNAY